MSYKFRNFKVLRSSVQGDKNCKWVVYKNGNLLRTFPTKLKAVQFVDIEIMVTSKNENSYEYTEEENQAFYKQYGY